MILLILPMLVPIAVREAPEPPASNTSAVAPESLPVMVSFAGMTGHVRDDPQEAETGSPCDSRILDEPKSADEREGQS